MHTLEQKLRIEELNGLVSTKNEIKNKEVFDLSGIIKQSPHSIELYEDT